MVLRLMLLYVNFEGELFGYLVWVWMVCLWWSLLNYKIYLEIGLFKEKIWVMINCEKCLFYWW